MYRPPNIKDMPRPKVIQIQKCVVGDNITSSEVDITTLLYGDGSVWEGSMQQVSGNYNDGYKYEMKWQQVVLPK